MGLWRQSSFAKFNVVCLLCVSEGGPIHLFQKLPKLSNLYTVHDALCAESEACIAALQAAIQYGLSRIILETDSLSLVRAL